MVDGIPVYNNVSGGTFWETIPVAMSQIERIDVVRGPSSALYGPNAVSGVINIITKKAGDKKVAVNGNHRVGNYNSYIGDLFVTSALSKKFKVGVSGKYDVRNRYDDKYYSYLTGQYVERGDGITNLTGIDIYRAQLKQSLSTDRAKEVYAGNLNLNYEATSDINFNLSAGIQDSKIQTIFFENIATPFSCRNSQTTFTSFVANVKNLSASLGYQFGKQKLSEGMVSPVIDYDMSSLNANMEYNFILDKLSIRPGINYQYSTYDDSDYEKDARVEEGNDNINGLFHGKKIISLFGGSVRADYKPNEKLRIIGALRTDKYKYIDDNYLSYQFVVSYKVNKNNILRALYSQANRGAFTGDVHSNFKNPILVDKPVPYPTPEPLIQGMQANPASAPLVPFIPATIPATVSYNQYYIGSKNSDRDLKLLTVNTMEVGWRSVLSKKLQIDIEAFYSEAKDFNSLVSYVDTTYSFLSSLNLNVPTGFPVTAIPLPPNTFPGHIQIEDSMFYENLPLKASQIGASFTINYAVNNKWQLKAYGTFQQTKLKNHITIEGDTIDKTYKYTPSFFGGLTSIYSPTKKLNIYLGIYGYGEQTYNRYWILSNKDTKAFAEDKLKAKFIATAKVSYKVWNESSVFVEGKNLLFDDNREFGFADPVKSVFYAGINLNF
jgi:iron complex outermembrane receptor protein